VKSSVHVLPRIGTAVGPRLCIRVWEDNRAIVFTCPLVIPQEGVPKAHTGEAHIEAIIGSGDGMDDKPEIMSIGSEHLAMGTLVYRGSQGMIEYLKILFNEVFDVMPVPATLPVREEAKV
jgi:hypothetical protein